MHLPTRTGFVLLFAGFALGGVKAQYLGAKEAIRESVKPLPAPAKKVAPTDAFRNSAKTYYREMSRLTPAESARRWLALAEAQPGINFEPWIYSGPPEPSTLMRVLPSPQVWPEIERQARVQESTGKVPTQARIALIIAEILQGKRDQAWSDLNRIKGTDPHQADLLVQIRIDLAMLDRRPDRIEAAFRAAVPWSNTSVPDYLPPKSLTLPDLTAMLGEARARALVDFLLESFDGELVANENTPFAALVQQEALRLLAKLKHPQWAAATDVDRDDGRLFTAIRRQFPGNIRSISFTPGWTTTYDASTTRYLVWLVAHGHESEAAPYFDATKASFRFETYAAEQELPLLERTHRLAGFLSFLESVIASGNGTGFIMEYRQLAYNLGQEKRANLFISSQTQDKLGVNHFEPMPYIYTLVEQGRVMEAGETLAKRIHETKASSVLGANYIETQELTEIGRFLNRPDWVQLGISAAEAGYLHEQFPDYYAWVCFDLAAHGRGVEAEQLIAESARARIHVPGTPMPPEGSQQLIALAKVYAEVGRWSDTLAVLDQATNLGTTDLAFLDSTEPGPQSIPFTAATALAKLGRRSEALHILKFILRKEPNLDEAYALLLDVAPQHAGAFLDEMHRAQPTLTRPLIWKAELVRRQGRYAEALALLSQAERLDPEDTQALYDADRFVSQEIRSRILRDQGKTVMSDEAHRIYTESQRLFMGWNLFQTHMDFDGPAMRRKLLAENPNDFVLRSAVARDLQASGDEAGAEREEARVLRDGLDHAGPAGTPDIGYRHRSDTNLASDESLFRQATLSDSGSAAAWFALGWVQQQRRESQAALASYLKAVAADSNWIAAWKGIIDFGGRDSLPLPFLDQLAMAEARLMPTELPSHPFRARNFADVWRTADANLRGSEWLDEPMYPLKSSAQQPGTAQNDERVRAYFAPPTAGRVIGMDLTISHLDQLLQSVGKIPAAGAE